MGLFSPKFSTKTMAALTRSLSMLVQGGVTLVRAFEVTAEGTNDKRIRWLLTQMADTIRRGGSLADAVRAQNRRLPELFAEYLIVAEHAGKEHVVLKHLATVYEEALELQREIIRAVSYPVCLWITAAFIIPYIRGAYLTSDPLELYTLQFILAVIMSYAPTLTVLIILGQLGLLLPLARRIASYWWPISRLTYRLAVSHFFQCVAILLDAGIPMRQSVERGASVCLNPRVRKALLDAVPLIQRGTEPEEAFARGGLLDPIAVDMVRSAEFSGRHEELFTKLAQYYREEAYHYIRSFTIGLEAYLILAIALSQFGLLPFMFMMVGRIISAE